MLISFLNDGDIGCGFEFKNGFEILGLSILKKSGPFFELTIFI